MDQDKLSQLIKLRHDIHSDPELSGKEFQTVKKINDIVKFENPDKTIPEIGKSGISYIYKGAKHGPTVLIRADIDALPIHETLAIKHSSMHRGISHKCGHDGHTAILVGLASYLSENKPLSGRVILLFQPAEEIGQGATWVINDRYFETIKPDYAFALHNLPGFEKGNLVLKRETFAWASVGLQIQLLGKTSHASEPEKGNSPALSMATIISRLHDLNSDHAFSTTCYSRLGEPSFGISPGFAELYVTLRSNTNENMEELKNSALSIVTKTAGEYKIDAFSQWDEEFPATINHDDCIDIIEKAAKKAHIPVLNLDESFKWSEDFGHFSQVAKSALFGLGAGTNQPPLHHPDYDFPDDIIETGIQAFISIIDEILNQ